MKRSLLLAFFASIPGAFIIGLLLNAYYQADVYHKTLSANVRVAVFVTPKANTEIVAERLRNTDGVADFELVKAEEVLDRALREQPAIKEVMVSGDNPFSTYFVLTPHSVLPADLSALKSRITLVDGVDDVRYDEHAATVAGTLSEFTRFYRESALGVLAAGGVIFIAGFIRRFQRRKLDYGAYFVLAGTGALAGALAACIYYLLSTQLIPSAGVQLPLQHYAYFLLGGLLTLVVWES